MISDQQQPRIRSTWAKSLGNLWVACQRLRAQNDANIHDMCQPSEDTSVVNQAGFVEPILGPLNALQQLTQQG